MPHDSAGVRSDEPVDVGVRSDLDYRSMAHRSGHTSGSGGNHDALLEVHDERADSKQRGIHPGTANHCEVQGIGGAGERNARSFAHPYRTRGRDANASAAIAFSAGEHEGALAERSNVFAMTIGNSQIFSQLEMDPGAADD